MAAFYPFLYGDQGHFPERNAGDYRVASFVGAIGSDQLVLGPALDTDEINDVHEILILLGLQFGEMQLIRRNDGGAGRFGWIGFGPILAITQDIIFALSETNARDFLLDLKAAVEMMKTIRAHEKGGCMIEIILPKGA